MLNKSRVRTCRILYCGLYNNNKIQLGKACDSKEKVKPGTRARKLEQCTRALGSNQKITNLHSVKYELLNRTVSLWLLFFNAPSLTTLKFFARSRLKSKKRSSALHLGGEKENSFVSFFFLLLLWRKLMLVDYCCLYSNCVPTKSDEKISFSLAFFWTWSFCVWYTLPAQGNSRIRVAWERKQTKRDCFFFFSFPSAPEVNEDEKSWYSYGQRRKGGDDATAGCGGEEDGRGEGDSLSRVRETMWDVLTGTLREEWKNVHERETVK